jgi:hypothetical protein
MQLLATAALLLLLIGAGVLIHEARLLNGEAPATTPSTRTANYQNMVAADAAKILAARTSSCQSVRDTGCPAVLAGLAGSVNQSLSDVDTVQPPSRFVALAAYLRQHFRTILTDFNSAEAAFSAADQTRMIADENAGLDELAVTETLVTDMVQAQPVTVSDYREQIALLLDDFQACGEACQAVLSQPNASCPAAAACLPSEITLQATLEESQGFLASAFPPPSLSAADARLQDDLARAHAALAQMIMLNGSPRTGSVEYESALRTLVSAVAAFSSDGHKVLGH